MVGNDEQVRVGHDRSERVGNDERITITQDQHFEVGRDRLQAVGRDHQISIGNHRHDTIAVNHRIEVGGQVEHTVQGDQRVFVGKGIETQTTVFELQANQRLVLKGPGGSITLDASGITLDGTAIFLKGPLQQLAIGQGNTLAISSTTATGHPICVGCWLKAARENKAIVAVGA
ncbi:hypothetical protein D3C85_1316140 [compost metagenome]